MIEPEDKIPKLGLAAREAAAMKAGKFDEGRSLSPHKRESSKSPIKTRMSQG